MAMNEIVDISKATVETPDHLWEGKIGVPGGELGKDAFLQLLVEQMKNQDPLSPMDSRESIAQLAQFSSLEQMQNVNEQLEEMRQVSGFMEAALLTGRGVELSLMNESQVHGVVNQVSWLNGELTLHVDGSAVPVSHIQSLRLWDPEEEAEESVQDNTSHGTSPGDLIP